MNNQTQLVVIMQLMLIILDIHWAYRGPHCASGINWFPTVGKRGSTYIKDIISYPYFNQKCNTVLLLKPPTRYSFSVASEIFMLSFLFYIHDVHRKLGST